MVNTIMQKWIALTSNIFKSKVLDFFNKDGYITIDVIDQDTANDSISTIKVPTLKKYVKNSNTSYIYNDLNINLEIVKLLQIESGIRGRYLFIVDDKDVVDGYRYNTDDANRTISIEHDGFIKFRIENLNEYIVNRFTLTFLPITIDYEINIKTDIDEDYKQVIPYDRLVYNKPINSIEIVIRNTNTINEDIYINKGVILAE